MIITAEVLKNVLENIPNDFEICVEFNSTIHPISDNVEVRLSEKKVILK